MLAEIRPPAGLLDAGARDAAMPEDTLEQIAAKETALARLHAGSWLHLKAACDLYVAAFFAPKTEPPPASPVGLATATMPLTDHVWRAADGHGFFRRSPQADKRRHSVHAFHWPLEFPDILARGGFDAVVGNPPWEVIELRSRNTLRPDRPRSRRSERRPQAGKKALARTRRSPSAVSRTSTSSPSARPKRRTSSSARRGASASRGRRRSTPTPCSPSFSPDSPAPRRVSGRYAPSPRRSSSGPRATIRRPAAQASSCRRESRPTARPARSSAIWSKSARLQAVRLPERAWVLRSDRTRPLQVLPSTSLDMVAGQRSQPISLSHQAGERARRNRTFLLAVAPSRSRGSIRTPRLRRCSARAPMRR